MGINDVVANIKDKFLNMRVSTAGYGLLLVLYSIPIIAYFYSFNKLNETQNTDTQESPVIQVDEQSNYNNFEQDIQQIIAQPTTNYDTLNNVVE